jgi:hypothetical protein
MCKNFEESFREFITKRLSDDLNILYVRNSELEAIYRDINMYHQNVVAAFEKGDKEAFENNLDEYSSNYCAVSGIIEEIAYIQGMKDLYKFFKMLEAEEIVKDEGEED